MYQAILTTVKVIPIKGADNIAAGECAGYSVIVSKHTRDGELGVYFPVGGQLSHEMAMANDLYAKHPETGMPMGGHLDANRRVRTKRFMGIQAEGLWLPLSSLAWCYDSIDALADDLLIKGNGYAFEGMINGKFVCQRFTPKMTAQQAASAGKVRKAEIEGFPKHFDTAQLRMNLGQIKIGDRLYLSEKLHGTSGRTCKLRVPISLPWWKRAINVAAMALGLDGFATDKIASYSGTRNCIVVTGAAGEKGMKYREAAHERIAPLLHVGEVVYYEIVGFGDDGKPIMPPHSVPDKLTKLLGPSQTYSYGCRVPGGSILASEVSAFKIFVYRITQDGVDLTQGRMKNRCEMMGLEMCPMILAYTYDGHAERLMEICKAVCDGKGKSLDWSDVPNCYAYNGLDALRSMTILSSLDNSHIREGVCIRIERCAADAEAVIGSEAWHENFRVGMRFVSVLKYKSWLFCHLEEIRPNSDEAIDPEELEAQIAEA